MKPHLIRIRKDKKNVSDIFSLNAKSKIDNPKQIRPGQLGDNPKIPPKQLGISASRIKFKNRLDAAVRGIFGDPHPVKRALLYSAWEELVTGT